MSVSDSSERLPIMLWKRLPVGRAILLAALFIRLASCPAGYGDDTSALDRFGGLKAISFGAGRVFRTHFDGQRWWLVTPDGGAFLSLGVCVVSPRGDRERGSKRRPYGENIQAKYGSVEGWTAVTAARLRSWGFNTLGNWSGDELRDEFPYTKELPLSQGLWQNYGAGGLMSNRTFPDFFNPAVQEHIRNRAAIAAATANDPFLIGYYLGNELPWARDWRLGPDIFPGYMALPSEAPGKQRLVAFFKKRYSTIKKFNAAWSKNLKDWGELEHLQELDYVWSHRTLRDQEDFALLVAREFFGTATEAVHAHDPDHLILGCRFFWAVTPAPVVRACGEFCDVVSINYYEGGMLGKLALWLTTSMRVRTDLTFRSFHDLAKKPLLVTEFSFRAMDSGLPNTYPPPSVVQPRVPTQMIRADKFERCATTWMAQPYFLGYHWFKYSDQPAAGRSSDGENGNYGLVNINDEPYTTLVERCSAVNGHVWSMHKDAVLADDCVIAAARRMARAAHYVLVLFFELIVNFRLLRMALGGLAAVGILCLWRRLF